MAEVPALLINRSADALVIGPTWLAWERSSSDAHWISAASGLTTNTAFWETAAVCVETAAWLRTCSCDCRAGTCELGQAAEYYDIPRCRVVFNEDEAELVPGFGWPHPEIPLLLRS